MYEPTITDFSDQRVTVAYWIRPDGKVCIAKTR
jgi:hypothetical protein